MRRNIFIIVVLALAVTFGTVYLFRQDSQQLNEDSTFLKYKDPQLTEDQKKPLLDIVTKNESELKELPASATAEERYQKYLAIGSGYFPLGELGKSRDAYLEAGKLLPQYPIAWFGAATTESVMGDADSALLHIDKAINLDPVNTEYWRMKISIIKDRKSPTDSDMVKLYADALKATNNSPDIISVYAKYLSDKGDLVGSVAQWKQAIEKNPEGKAIYDAEIKKLQDRLK